MVSTFPEYRIELKYSDGGQLYSIGKQDQVCNTAVQLEFRTVTMNKD